MEFVGGHSHDGVERPVQGRDANEAHHILYAVRTCLVHGKSRVDVIANERIRQFVERDVADIQKASCAFFEGGDGDSGGDGMCGAAQG